MNKTRKNAGIIPHAYFYLVVGLLFVSFGQSKAQYYDDYSVTITVDEISLIRIYPSTPISLNLLADQAGQSMAPKTHAGSYLQLTSIAPADEPRHVMVRITSGSVPNGTLLKLTPTACSTGSGTRGSVSATRILNSSSNQTIISGIGSAYTGGFSADGYRLIYSWEIDPSNYASLHATQSVSLILTYTIATD